MSIPYTTGHCQYT